MSNYYIRDGKSLFKFVNGTEVEIRPVSPLYVELLRKNFPPPKPPMQKIELADGSFGMEPNPAAPSYELAVKEWEEMIEDKARRVLISEGVRLQLTDLQRAEVERRRAFMRDNFNLEIKDNDEYFYVAYCLISSENEYRELCSAISGRSHPTEAAVASAVESFSREIS